MATHVVTTSSAVFSASCTAFPNILPTPHPTPHTVYRLTLVKGWNMEEVADYARLVDLGRWEGLTLNQSRKETVARQGELQLQKRVVVHHRM